MGSGTWVWVPVPQRKRIGKRKSAASVSFCIQRKIANYLEESKELLTFAASTRQYVLNLNILIMGNSRQQKAENRVKFPRLLGSVELFMYFCHE